MNIRVECTGTISEARVGLATLIAKSSFKPLARFICSVTVRVPPTDARAVRTCEVCVDLQDGRAIVRSASAASASDAMETACHAARLDVYRALGLALPQRRAGRNESDAFDRRAA